MTEIQHRDDEHAILIALFRYGVIAELAERKPGDDGTVTDLVTQIAEKTHYLPGKGAVRVRERTVYAWLRRFKQGGLSSLRPRHRKDKGLRRVLTDAVLQRAIELRKENPERHTSTLIDILKREGTLDSKVKQPHRATLDRHLSRRSASRRQMRTLGNKRTIKMEFENFGDLWVGDYHHGPLVLSPSGQAVVAKLGAFIDHTTRWPVADRYYLSEDLGTLRDTLLRALLKWGKFKKAYVDNGSVYRAEQLAYSLRCIDCELIHSRAYYSQGRGVIERWWQVADAFESEVRAIDGLLTIHELNTRWEAWKELRYCDAIHSALGKTPREAIALVVPQPLSPEVARELFLCGEDRQVHKHDGCVSILGRRYLCESFLRGQTVKVRYDVNDLTSVLIFVDGKRVGRALPQVPNTTPEPHPEPVERARQSVDYLALLRADFDKRLLLQAAPARYADIKADPGFNLDGFQAVVTQLAGLKRGPSVERELGAFFETYAPLPETLVRIGTEHAVRLHGRGRHIQVYLHAIRTLLLAHMKSPPNKEKP